ncbi:imidazole glycerol phosphate synthase subunit HisH [Sphingomonas sediminicola]|uniref:Imidazole glycerol phosphate synthase subunit HisH n=1 Tax=Sphingomonas sediminicola TaxID=386874 RepID=A0ABX6TAN3_9SPHN|nr:imidazole glycerol phosphate synthase subunit HisH [Sphingomonas sediminicola]QNP46441.1 imidazole glycerol phosphate synthase subunit HisH [Sphingomonas sediminicola]
MKLAIVDLGCGNIGSVRLAFRRFGLSPFVTADPEQLAAADKVVLPGVGAAGFAMERIQALGLREPLRSLKQPALGICLGMQLLFDRSEEEDVDCLGIIPGAVRALEPEPERPVPHMGWSRVHVGNQDLGLRSGDYVYFAHSYACDDGPATVARADYGRPIPAVVRTGNWLGAQFHPERSGEAGARFLQSFLQ